MENKQNKNLGIILIVLGAFFFLSRFMNLSDFLWPFFIIVPGLLLFVGMIAGGRQFSGLAIPASIVTTVGGILFTQNITNHFESWAYSWALIPASAGLGMVIMASQDGNLKLEEKGFKLIKTFLMMFLGFGVFFELFIFHSWMNTGLIAYAIPIVLIIAGLYILKKPRGNYVYIEENDGEHDEDFEDEDDD